jgi:hypothetical protein
MNGALDVRKFLWQQEEGLRRPSSTVPSPRASESARLSDEQVHQARIAVARGAQDAEDCKLLLDMLGLVPDEEGTLPVTR